MIIITFLQLFGNLTYLAHLYKYICIYIKYEEAT